MIRARITSHCQAASTWRRHSCLLGRDFPETLAQTIGNTAPAAPGFLPPETFPAGTVPCSSRPLLEASRRAEMSLSDLLIRWNEDELILGRGPRNINWPRMNADEHRLKTNGLVYPCSSVFIRGQYAFWRATAQSDSSRRPNCRDDLRSSESRRRRLRVRATSAAVKLFLRAS